MQPFTQAMSLENLPVLPGLNLPPITLGLIPLVCVLLLAFVIRRMVRDRPRPHGVFAFLTLALVGAILQFTDHWWQLSLPVLIVMTGAAIGSIVEVSARSSLRRHGRTVAAVAAINSGAYLYLVAVLRAHS